MKVKKLRWKSDGDFHYALTPFSESWFYGGYSVRPMAGSWKISTPEQPSGTYHDTLELGKAACQTDFEERVRKCLK